MKRERYLSRTELQRLGQVLSDVERDGSETPYIVAAFRLLILTGCRLGEIQTLKWDYITPDGMIVGLLFVVLLLFGMPIGFAIGIVAFVGLYQTGGASFAAQAPGKMFNGLNIFPFLAMPFFILAGEIMTAEEAERSGLVSRVVPAKKLMEEAMSAATKIAEKSMMATMAAKESVNRSYETTLSEGLLFERRVFHSMFATEDQKEGMKLFDQVIKVTRFVFGKRPHKPGLERHRFRNDIVQHPLPGLGQFDFDKPLISGARRLGKQSGLDHFCDGAADAGFFQVDAIVYVANRHLFAARHVHQHPPFWHRKAETLFIYRGQHLADPRRQNSELVGQKA